MINAHKVVDYLKKNFDRSDEQIVILLSAGAYAMKKALEDEMNISLSSMISYVSIKNIDAYLSGMLEEEFDNE